MRVTAATIAISSLLISGHVLALTPAGKTMIAKGDVKAYEQASNARKLKRRAPIYGVDTVETAEKSKAQFRMTDGTLLALKESSKLLISEYQYNQEEGGGSAVLELVEGGLRSVTGAIKSNNGTYELKTPVGSIGIRGTHYEIEIIQGEVFIAVWDGAVDVNVEVGFGQEVSLGEGEDYSYAKIDENGDVTEMLEPPDNFNEGHSDDPTQQEEESEEEGDSEEGNSEEGDSEEGNSEEGDSEEGDSEEGDSEEGDSEEGDSEEGGSEEGGSEEGGSEEGDSEEGGSEEGGSEEGGSEEGGSEEGGSEEGGSEEGGSEGGSSGESGSEGGSSEESGSEGGNSGEGASGSGDNGSGSDTGSSGTGGSGDTGDNTGGTGADSSGTDPNTGGGGNTDPGSGGTDSGGTDTGDIGGTDTAPPDLGTTPPPDDPAPGDTGNPGDEATEEQRDNQIIQEINNNTRALPQPIADRTGTASFSQLIESSFDSGTGNPRNLNINISVNFDQPMLTEGDLSIDADNGQWAAFFQGILIEADFELDFTSVTFGIAGQPGSVLEGTGTWGETFLANEADVINGRFSLSQGSNNVSARFVLGETP